MMIKENKEMYEKVNPAHPDKIADRIAGAMLDLAYSRQENPRVAVEVLIGHSRCHIIAESSYPYTTEEVERIVDRIVRDPVMVVDLKVCPQSRNLAKNQENGPRCGDNGIFKGMPVTEEQRYLTDIANSIYLRVPADGKYLIDDGQLTICQSHVRTQDLQAYFPDAIVNPLGDWSGGPDEDTGATNRKLGSDMGDAVTGGGLHGKDYSKADVSVNIYAHLKAQITGQPVELSCAIGDEYVDGRPFSDIVKIARDYINSLGGFEKFAEWGLIR